MPSLTDLFGIGGGGEEDSLGFGGMGSGDAQSMALLQAMGGIQEAGMRRHASPIGSIADTLAPLLGAHIQAKQMERQQALQELLLRAKIFDLVRGSGKAITPEETELTKAKTKNELSQAAKNEMEAKSPFGGKSPTEAQLAQGKMAGDPTLGPLYDFMQAADRAKFDANREAINSSVSARMEEADARRVAAQRNKRLPTNQVYLDPTTGERLPFKTQGELEDAGVTSVPVSPQQATTVSDIKNAYRELQNLKGAASKVLYDAKPEDGILGSMFGVQGNRAKLALKGRGGDADVRVFEATKKSAALALARALTRTGRVPVAEFGAIDALDAGKDTVQSAQAILGNFEGYLTGILQDYGLDPSLLQSDGKPTLEGILGGAKPMRSTTPGPVSLDFDNPGMRSAFENIRSKYPKMTPTEMADFYSSHGDPGRGR